MKEMKDKTGNITGYEIENSVLIHSHISDRSKKSKKNYVS